jgi:YHS domain-containing protein
MKNYRTAHFDFTPFLRFLLLMTAAAIAAITIIGTAGAGETVFSTGGGAIAGYDPVAYFTDGKPIKGAKNHSAEWKGATWHFASADNKAKFEADPAKYAPQYGGFCAWAVSQGYTAKIDPVAWHIEDGKLYLNYNKSVQKRWTGDIPGNISKGDTNWPGIMAELAAK